MSVLAPILIVDDDGWLASQYSRTLEAAGYRPFIAANALEAMDMIDKHHPHAIVLDIFMPGPNGIVLLHEMRSHSDLANIPIIVCSNSASDIPHGNLAKYGVMAVLDKTTMHPDDIVTAVRRVLP